MRVVHLATEPVFQKQKKVKLANDPRALQAGLMAWKLKHNAKLEREEKLKNL